MVSQHTKLSKKPALSASPLQLLIAAPDQRNPAVEMVEMLDSLRLTEEKGLIKTLLSTDIQHAMDLGEDEVSSMRIAKAFLVSTDAKPAPVVVLGF